MSEAAALVEAALWPRLSGARRPFVLGLCGAQGSGKSTLAAALHRRLTEDGLRAAILSLDDLYRTKAERAVLAREVHPLFAARGVPGTHDVALGEATFAALAGTDPVALPRFDKAADDRCDPADWPIVEAPIDVLIFEGWCVGARAQPPEELARPINALEREEDRDGRWRMYVNAALASDYARLFARLDMLVLLAAPSFDVVAGWRAEQEAELRRRLEAEGRSTEGLMDGAAIARFVAHYERITRALLAEMPGRADLTLHLDEARRVVSYSSASTASTKRASGTGFEI